MDEKAPTIAPDQLALAIAETPIDTTLGCERPDEEHPERRLDERTCQLGRAGVRTARRALAECGARAAAQRGASSRPWGLVRRS